MSASFTRAVNRFEKAVREHEMMGAQHPEEHARIEKHYQTTKQDLKRAFAQKGRSATLDAM